MKDKHDNKGISEQLEMKPVWINECDIDKLLKYQPVLSTYRYSFS